MPDQKENTKSTLKRPHTSSDDDTVAKKSNNSPDSKSPRSNSTSSDDTSEWKPFTNEFPCKQSVVTFDTNRYGEEDKAKTLSSRLKTHLYILEHDFEENHKKSLEERNTFKYKTTYKKEDEENIFVIETQKLNPQNQVSDHFILKIIENKLGTANPKYIFSWYIKIKKLTKLTHCKFKDIIRLQYLILAAENKFLGEMPISERLWLDSIELYFDPEIYKSVIDHILDEHLRGEEITHRGSPVAVHNLDHEDSNNSASSSDSEYEYNSIELNDQGEAAVMACEFGKMMKEFAEDFRLDLVPHELNFVHEPIAEDFGSIGFAIAKK